MSRGICIFAQNNSKSNYVEQATVLAESICNFSDQKVSIITNDEVKQSVFDQTITIPDDKTDYNSWRIQNRSRIYDLSPYDETIVLDSDMIALEDFENYWRWLDTDLYFTTQAYTFRGTVSSASNYRKQFVANNLPNIYSAFYYFKKSATSKKFFEELVTCVDNWQAYYNVIAPIHKQDVCSIDVCSAIVSKIQNIKYPNFPIRITHMKPYFQDCDGIEKDWMNNLLFWKQGNSYYINNIKQTGLLHYVSDDFLSYIQ